MNASLSWAFRTQWHRMQCGGPSAPDLHTSGRRFDTVRADRCSRRVSVIFLGDCKRCRPSPSAQCPKSVPTGSGAPGPAGQRWGHRVTRTATRPPRVARRPHVGIDRQRHRRVMAVPCGDDVRRVALVEHESDRGIPQAVQANTAQPGRVALRVGYTSPAKGDRAAGTRTLRG